MPFERYCDDAVVHCVSGRQAHRVKMAIGQDGRSRAATAPDQDQDRLLQGRQQGPAPMRTPRSRSWGSRSGPCGAVQDRGEIRLLPARDQQTSLQEETPPGYSTLTAVRHSNICREHDETIISHRYQGLGVGCRSWIPARRLGGTFCRPVVPPIPATLTRGRTRKFR